MQLLCRKAWTDCGVLIMQNESSNEKLKYLQLLGEKYCSVEALCTEITRLSAQLSLPKGTEHFMSDIHGEYEAFCHIMNNCSGVIREKVQLWLGGQVTHTEADELCTLIYYPQAVLRRKQTQNESVDHWYRQQIHNLVFLAKMLSSKYTREKVRREIPNEWSFLIDELMHFQDDESAIHTEQDRNRLKYHDAIVDSVIKTGSVEGLLIALTELIKHLAVDRLHVVGDIYDRGPRADSIMDILMKHPSVDIEWGNHDILWMGAASGSEVCIFGVLRNSIAHGNTVILERGYGIPLRNLALTAKTLYPDLSQEKALLHFINIVLFKLEGQLIVRNPDFGMEKRMLLHLADFETGKITIDGQTWPMKQLPSNTIIKSAPYELSEEEAVVVQELHHSFTHSIRLKQHISFLYRRGWMYRSFNGNLMFHGCIPLNDDGTFMKVSMHGKDFSGKALMDYADQMARRAFYSKDQIALDFMWYLWCGADSPVCGREVKTFERAFIPDKTAWEEPRNPYYIWYNDENCCLRILKEFGLEGPFAHIINGHTPIRVTHGESPLKAGGRLIVIDGGFCKAYQKTTGIAGYTLIANSHGMRLMSHQPFTSLKEAQETGQDIHSQSFEFTIYPKRQYVKDTDYGKTLTERINDLTELLCVCRNGEIHLKEIINQ